MKRSLILMVLALLPALMLLSACGGSSEGVAYRDGTFVGKSSEDDNGAFGEAAVTVEDGKIIACQYVTWQKDGTVKDENYGKVNGEISNQDYYDKAQLAVNAMAQYARELVEVQSPGDVDAVAGATISHNQFIEAAGDALSQAKE